MLNAAVSVPLSTAAEMVPIVPMLVQELRLGVVHAVQAETIKVLLD